MQLLQGQLLTAYESAKAGGAGTIAPGLQFRDVLYWLSERQNKGAPPETVYRTCTHQQACAAWH